MTTNIIHVFEILDSYTDNAGALDIAYFADCVEIVADNNRPTSEQKYNTRRKARNVAIEWLLYFIKTELYFVGYEKEYPTSKQVIKWDRTHGGQLEKVLDMIQAYIEEDRNNNK